MFHYSEWKDLKEEQNNEAAHNWSTVNLLKTDIIVDEMNENRAPWRSIRNFAADPHSNKCN